MRILLFELNFVLKSLPNAFTNTQISFKDMKRIFKSKFHQGAPTVTCVGGFSSVAFYRQKVQKRFQSISSPLSTPLCSSSAKILLL